MPGAFRNSWDMPEQTSRQERIWFPPAAENAEDRIGQKDDSQDDGEGEGEDPRDALVRRLLEKPVFTGIVERAYELWWALDR